MSRSWRGFALLGGILVLHLFTGVGSVFEGESSGPIDPALSTRGFRAPSFALFAQEVVNDGATGLEERNGDDDRERRRQEREARKAEKAERRRLKQLKQGGEDRERPGDGRDDRGDSDRRERKREKGRKADHPNPAAMWPVASVLLGQPGSERMTVCILPFQPFEGVVEFWKAGTLERTRTASRTMAIGQPSHLVLEGLTENTAYEYRVVGCPASGSDTLESPVYRFHTQRPPGASFVFELQGDSHPERPHQHDPALYEQTLLAAERDHPDFYLTMGDDFSADKLEVATPQAIEQIYAGHHRYLGVIGRSAPLFLVNGNHEQAALCNLDGTPDNVAVLAQNARNRFFPQPGPEGIFSGNEEQVPHIGLLRDYFAWTWGDALFVVIDPYWHSAKPVDTVYGGGPKNRDWWAITLGEKQYRWFARVLESSPAKYKFVFTHHVLGTGRGGIEMAHLYEWGGQNKRCELEFAQQRPGWEYPIHPLMVRNGVTIFFQGHDHLFCRQELDGVVYQELPDPANPNYLLNNGDRYLSGDALPGSGRVRVTVAPEQVTVEYLRSFLPQDVTASQTDGTVAFSYVLKPKAGAAVKILEKAK